MTRGGTGRDVEDEREPVNSRKPGKLDEAGGATYRTVRRR
jgi:hypothetical protein